MLARWVLSSAWKEPSRSSAEARASWTLRAGTGTRSSSAQRIKEFASDRNALRWWPELLASIARCRVGHTLLRVEPRSQEARVDRVVVEMDREDPSARISVGRIGGSSCRPES